MDRGPKQTFFHRRHANGQQAHEKMPNITNHPGNGTETIMRPHLTPVRMASVKKTRNNKLTL